MKQKSHVSYVEITPTNPFSSLTPLELNVFAARRALEMTCSLPEYPIIHALQPIDAHNTYSILFAGMVMQAEEKSHDSDPARVASFAKLSDRSPRGFSILLNTVIDLMVDHLDTSVESEL